MNIFKKTETGYEFAYDNERALDVVDRLCRLINENENVLAGKHNSDNPEYMISTGGGNYASRAFVEGRSLFTMGLIADASVIVPEIDFDWGLLPYPQWDETQTEYATMLQRNCMCLYRRPCLTRTPPEPYSRLCRASPTGRSCPNTARSH